MDAFAKQQVNADIFKNNSFILLHCCDLSYSFDFTIPSLPFLTLKAIYFHFTFDNSPERRMCIIPFSVGLIEKLENLESPCTIQVLSSCIFEFDPQEVELPQDQKLLLIWDFKVVLNLAVATRPHQHNLPEIMPFTPMLSLDKVKCNCSNFPDTNDVLVNEANLEDIQDDDNADDDNGDDDNGDAEDDRNGDYNGDDDNDNSDAEDDNQDEDNDSENEDITHTLPFKCIGAAHDRHNQIHLERAQEALARGENVKVNLRPEPTNQYDAEAIAINMDYGTDWTNVGYIARELTQYIHPLLNQGKILDVSVEHIVFRVNFFRMGFYPKILIKRSGQWENLVIRKSRSVR